MPEKEATEYSGTATIGVDMSRGSMDVNGNNYRNVKIAVL
jgi:hypothetical protein